MTLETESDHPPIDVVVIGTSAGGVEALRSLASLLPSNFGAAVVIVLHLPASGVSVMPQILARSGKNRAVQAVDGMRLRRGTLFVASPDHHIGLDGNTIRLTRGPRENGTRPAIDPLFRSAAASFGPRCMGVLLTGALDDGVGGLLAIRNAGGISVVQDPIEAPYPSMPTAALEAKATDRALPISRIADMMSSVVEPLTDDASKEIAVADPPLEVVDAEETRPGEPGGMVSALTCPNCHGALWVDEIGDTLRYACRTGHEFAPESLLEGQSDALDDALWGAYRALLERADLCRRLGGRMRRRKLESSGARYDRMADDALNRANVIRTALTAGNDIDADLADAPHDREADEHL